MIITNEIIKSSYFCLYKTYLKISGEFGKQTEYEEMESEIKNELISKYISSRNSKSIGISNRNISNKGNLNLETINRNISYSNNSYSIHFDAIEKIDNDKIPIYFSPNSTIIKYEKEYISCLATIVNAEFSEDVKTCKIVFIRDNKLITQKVKVAFYQKSAKIKLTQINRLSNPEFYLNKHCILCEFNTFCKQKARKNNHLSLLNKATPKIINKYKKKGIFTVNQLSYLYKPRRRRRKKVDVPLIHNIELQALAIRTEKTYVKTLEPINRSEVELFIDIEAVPRLDFYYLFGVILRKQNRNEYYSFWVNQKGNQKEIWQKFLNFLEKYPNAHIYHYGNFELKTFGYLAKKHHINVDSIINRFVNVNSFIHGKIYFPVYSNGLKDICKFLGVKWGKSGASGLQSIIWRFHWEKGNKEKKDTLIDYNKTDCMALHTLLERIYEIMQLKKNNEISRKIDFVDNIQKQTTKKGKELHEGLETILKIAHENYDEKKMSISNFYSINNTKEKVKKKGYFRTTPKTKNIISVRRKLICPKHKCVLLRTNKESKQTITDMVFTKNTIRKRVVCFKGVKSYC